MCTAAYKWTDDRVQKENMIDSEVEGFEEKELARIKAVKMMISASFWSASDRSFPTGRKAGRFRMDAKAILADASSSNGLRYMPTLNSPPDEDVFVHFIVYYSMNMTLASCALSLSLARVCATTEPPPSLRLLIV